ncbi:KH domain-containing protein [Candidatus Poribacteria bacterium]|nr:KH domain-containing protein [Candidatus Poribacteria bacterium]
MARPSYPAQASEPRLRELVEFIARSLVDQPDAVRVEETPGPRTTIVELCVAEEDIGKVIGKQGRTARAMRTVLAAAATRVNKRAVLEIVE